MKHLILCLLVASVAFGQKPNYGVVMRGAFDGSNATATAPHRTGSGSPVGTQGCAIVGESYFQSDATPGKNVFYCTTVGVAGVAVWTPQTALRTISAAFSNGGSALTAGTTVPLYAVCTTMAGAGTIVAWNIMVDTGAATFKLWKNSSASAVPTVSNSISTSGFAISTGTKIHSTTLTDLSSTTFAPGDNLCVQLSAVSGSVTDAKLILEYF